MTEPSPPPPAPPLPARAVTVRFAPSPTGLLHVGNVRTALINWLFARQQGGSFLLRIDDTDRERSTPAFEAAILSDLSWLGLCWSETFNQSARMTQYAAAAERLRAGGRLYPCYETALELDARRKRQLARGQPPVYDRAALRLSDAERAQRETEGRRPHWRFRLADGDVAWHDLVRGPCHYAAAHLSDPVLIREDGTILYTMTSVVDDIDSAISHVLRGEDHVTNTAVQIQLFEALGAAPPTFAHFPLLTDREGHGLSKRLGSLSIAELRDDGLEPMAINSLLARLGTSEAVQAVHHLDDLVATFDIGHFGRGTPKFDVADLHHLNARLLHDLPYSVAKPRLQSLDIHADEDFWLAVRGNLGHFREASDWWRICRATVSPTIEDAGLCAEAATLLPAEPWNGETWKTWTQSVAAATGRTGRALYHPLRLALTGRADGPELKTLLPLIGRARSLARLNGHAA